MSNYTAAEAVSYLRKFIKSIPTGDIEVLAADEINSRIWRYAPWYWTTDFLPPVTILDGEQDIGSKPTDYLRLVQARLVRTDTTPDEYLDPLDILNKLEPNLFKCSPYDIRAVAYIGHLGKFRLERAASIPTDTIFQLAGEYQTVPDKITSIDTELPHPDVYFSVFLAGMKWKLMEFAGDTRTGASQTRNGDAARNGAQSDFYAELWEMAVAEGFGKGDILSPSESLMAE